MKIFSPVNVKANFNFAIHQSKTFLIILVNTCDVSSLMLVKKQWYWVMLIACSIVLNWGLLKTWVKDYVTTKFHRQTFTILLRVPTKKNRFVLETRKPQTIFVVLCSIPYRVWHLNNVRVPLVTISLCWSQRPVNFWKYVCFLYKVTYVVDLSFFIKPPTLSRFGND